MFKPKVLFFFQLYEGLKNKATSRVATTLFIRLNSNGTYSVSLARVYIMNFFK